MQRWPILVISLSFCCAASVYGQTVNEAGMSTRENELKQEQVLKAGIQLIKDRRPADAIKDDFDKVIASYETSHPADTNVSTYCARNASESLAYLVQSTAAKKNAVVVGTVWCDAYFLRAYGLTELGRTAEARQSLEKAIAMAPRNSQYISELSNLYSRDKKWDEAIAGYDTAARLARESSPPASRNGDLGRALRGKGYALVELGRLDEAEAIYRQCLEIDAADKAAQRELQYVQTRREQKTVQ